MPIKRFVFNVNTDTNITRLLEPDGGTNGEVILVMAHCIHMLGNDCPRLTNDLKRALGITSCDEITGSVN